MNAESTRLKELVKGLKHLNSDCIFKPVIIRYFNEFKYSTRKLTYNNQKLIKFVSFQNISLYEIDDLNKIFFTLAARALPLLYVQLPLKMPNILHLFQSSSFGIIRISICKPFLKSKLFMF